MERNLAGHEIIAAKVECAHEETDRLCDPSLGFTSEQVAAIRRVQSQWTSRLEARLSELSKLSAVASLVRRTFSDPCVFAIGMVCGALLTLGCAALAYPFIT